MAKPIKQRKILRPYWPYSGTGILPTMDNASKPNNILYLAEEFEAIKLIDYEGLTKENPQNLWIYPAPQLQEFIKKWGLKNQHRLLQKGIKNIGREYLMWREPA